MWHVFQLVLARAFGFKTSKNLKITIFIDLGKLNLIPD